MELHEAAAGLMAASSVWADGPPGRDCIMVRVRIKVGLV
jgi:hypothetical protein